MRCGQLPLRSMLLGFLRQAFALNGVASRRVPSDRGIGLHFLRLATGVLNVDYSRIRTRRLAIAATASIHRVLAYSPRGYCAYSYQ